MLLERKHCFEKRGKGKDNFRILQTFSRKITIFAPKIEKIWKLRKQNLR